MLILVLIGYLAFKYVFQLFIDCKKILFSYKIGFIYSSIYSNDICSKKTKVRITVESITYTILLMHLTFTINSLQDRKISAQNNMYKTSKNNISFGFR